MEKIDPSKSYPGQAMRLNEGKPMMAYMLHYPKVMQTIARIMEYGALKYDEMNWKKGGKPDKEYLDACMRHLTLWVGGQTYDAESGCSHLGQAIWNLITLFELNHPEEIFNREQFIEVTERMKCQRKQAEQCGSNPIQEQINRAVVQGHY